MISRGWGPELNIDGNPHKNQWKIIDEGIADDKQRIAMLDTDMCLAVRDSYWRFYCEGVFGTDKDKCDVLSGVGRGL